VAYGGKYLVQETLESFKESKQKDKDNQQEKDPGKEIQTRS
jgi:hypothetical protein